MCDIFPHSKIRSETKTKPREGESNWHVLSFVCHMCVNWELQWIQETPDSGTVSHLRDHLPHPQHAEAHSRTRPEKGPVVNA